MTYRVAQWATGNVGRLALPAIINHPNLELVGLWVHSADKVGRDAGELCGLPPVGVTATNDVDEIIALKPDCVSHMATGDLRPHEAADEMIRLLEAGINVVSTSVVSLVYPPSAPRGMRERLEAACQAGGASCFTNGIDPGFANDLIPLVFTGVCERIDHVRVMEILNYDTYDQAEVLFETMGFGQPLDATPLLLFPGGLTLAWGPVVHMIAAGLGVEVDEIVEWHEKRPAERTFDIQAGTVEEGTMAGLRFEVRGMIGGEPRIVIEHVTRLDDTIAPDWPQPPGHGGYRVQITGNPNLTAELQMEGEDGDHNTAGLLVTAMRLLNAIPAVCAAPPGLLSTLDLPLVTGRDLMQT
jgi:2,4-diaminopentanoate dehydrogenase